MVVNKNPDTRLDEFLNNFLTVRTFGCHDIVTTQKRTVSHTAATVAFDPFLDLRTTPGSVPPAHTAEYGR